MGCGDLVHSWKLDIRSLIQAGNDRALDSCSGLETARSTWTGERFLTICSHNQWNFRYNKGWDEF